MRKGTYRAALAAAFSVTVAGSLLTAGCGVQSGSGLYGPASRLDPVQMPEDARFAQLASEMATNLPNTELLTAGPGTCGPSPAPVVHFVVPEQVLFATASDQPGPDASTALDDIARRVGRASSGAAVTVVGHTDAVGSDDYNMDLSKRRAATVLLALAARGLPSDRLSAVAAGKRQPVADNATAAGRARNRRVEFLISRCLAANLGVVTDAARNWALPAPDDGLNDPVEVMHLDPGAPYGLAPLATISLRAPQGGPPLATAVEAPGRARPVGVAPSVGVARPAPAPHFQSRTPLPEVQRNQLGPAVPF